MSNDLRLGLEGFSYPDLHDPARLEDLLRTFDRRLEEIDESLYRRYRQWHDCGGEGMEATEISQLMLEVAPHVGTFVARLFGVEELREEQIGEIEEQFRTIFACRSEVVAKLKALLRGEDPAGYDLEALEAEMTALRRAIPGAGDDEDEERAVSRVGATLARLAGHFQALARGKESEYPEAEKLLEALRRALAGEAAFAGDLELQEPLEFSQALLKRAARWFLAARERPEWRQRVAGWDLFRQPEKRDFDNLVEHQEVDAGPYSAWVCPPQKHRRRDGFHLTDPRFPERRVLYEVDHCIYCHERDTDSCSKGMRNRKTGRFQTNPLGVINTGCPLGEKISEMHLLKRQGDNIAALATIIIDNPMLPGTGHRICNDCMKACIYQKTEPVNIPQIETNVLTDVLFMPWGFEIYSLLTRWNPLNVKRPVALPYNGKNVLVVGMGPAGYTMAHYLLNEGFGVVGIDGLKLEPLPKELVGDCDTPPQPIRDFRDHYEDLATRRLNGFGGVAEYGITARWDKNFLKVIYISLLRRRSFRAYGGVRFGGTITINEAWDLGFDHICIAAGAGKPTIINLENNLIRGIRKASDFLMALQLTGAAKHDSLANLQVRLPAGVIGGGLTGIDTATELLAYYPVQVEKILQRYEALCLHYGEEKIRAMYDEEETLILDEFLSHGRAIRAERRRAEEAGEEPDFLPLLNEWGGVTMFYRKGMKDSPAYRQNHEEIAEALDEGIRLAEGMSPVEALADDYGHLRAVRFDRMALEDGRWGRTGYIEEVPLRSLFIAAGTSPNTIYESEFPGTFRMDGKFFQRYEPAWKDGEIELEEVHDEPHPKIGRPAPLTSYHRHGKFISFYGDNHPVYAGNVVKAMASARDSHPYIVNLFRRELEGLDPADQPAREAALCELFARLDHELRASVVSVRRLTPSIVEVVVKAPRAAEKFCPGRFYRVQNFEAHAAEYEGTLLATEGIALTGAEVDKEAGTISLIALEMGTSSRLCATWKPGDEVLVMGVTGTPTEIPSGRTVMLVGGGLGNAVLFSIGKAMRAAGDRVIYFAGYKHASDVFKVEDIEAASDLIVWSVDPAPGVEPIPVTRPQDKSFVGNIVESILAYARGDLGETPIHLDDVDHMVVIGSDRMMQAVKEARHGVLAPYLKQRHEAIGSINSPMQCMMKGVCAQCLCKHVDPETGEEHFVYSCYNQDQPLDCVDFPNLHARLRQNTVQEKLSNRWLDYIFEKHPIERI